MPRNLNDRTDSTGPRRNRDAIREALAGEYALGALHGRARDRFERLMAGDADLRRRVRQWEADLGPWVAEAPQAEPPEAVWQGIRSHLAEPGGTAPEAGGSGKGAGWWNSLPLWRGLAVAATVLLALVAAWSLGPGRAPMAPERMVVVTDSDQNPIWVVSSGAPEGMLRVRTLRSPEMGPNRVCPLWLKWEKGDRMQRVAVLPEEKGVYTFRVPSDVPIERARLAVSVEPTTAIPRDRPGGEVVYQGNWIQL